MRNRLLCMALLVCVACVKRVAPSAGEDRTVTAGIPVVYGSEQELPKDARIVWDFGDGTPPVEGARVEHAFARAGSFKVTQTVVDPDGQKRTSTSTATVLRRSVSAALPADARAALILEYPWNRIPLHRETATKLALRDVFDETARELSEALGFDALDPAAAKAHGFDPDEGVALFTVPQDPEGLVAAVGTSDDARSLAAVKTFLSRAGGGRFAGGPFELTDTRTENGVPLLAGAGRGNEKVAVVQRFGYLYLRLPGMSDPVQSLRSVLQLPPNAGLQSDPTFAAAVRHVGAGDVLFFSRSSNGNGQGRLAEQLGVSAFALVDRKELVEMRLFGQLKRLGGDELVKTFTPLKDPPDLAARLPSGPTAYMKISGRPDALWRELLKASQADATRARERIQELTGLDLEKDLLPSFTGNVGIATYLDASALLEAVLGEQVASFDRSGFLAIAELAKDKAQGLQAAIDRQVKPEQRVAFAGTTVWKLGEGAALAAVKDNFLYFALGGPAAQEEEQPPPRRRGRKPRPPPPPTAAQLGPIGAALQPAAGARSLSDQLKAAGVRGFGLPRDQIAWFDVQGLVRSVQAAAEGQGGLVSAGTRMMADRMGALRDALFEARPGPDGMQAEVFIRFQQAGRSEVR